jgi:hypothetical protein
MFRLLIIIMNDKRIKDVGPVVEFIMDDPGFAYFDL